MKRFLCLLMVLIVAGAASLSAASYNPVTGNANLNYPRSSVLYFRGADGLYYDTGTLPVSGTFTATPSGKQVVQGGSATDTPVYIQGTVTTGAAADVTLSDTIYEITLTDTATVDSSIVLPAKCTGFELWGQLSTTTVRWMLTSGTYAVQPPGTPYNTFDKGIGTLYSGRLYLKDTTEAGAKVTVIIWYKP